MQRVLADSVVKLAVVITTAGALFLNCSALAEDKVVSVNSQLGFFNQGSVVNLDSPLEFTEQQEIQFGPTKGFKIPEDPEINKTKSGEETKEEFSVKEDEIPEGVDAQQYALKKEFGDPSEPVPVKGVDTAPKPYKAMLKAIDMGRDDLALQYANQWMGYMKSLERVTKKATSMTQVVGLSSDQELRNVSPQTIADIDPAGLQKYFDKQKEEEKNSPSAANLEIDQSAKKSIDAFFGEGDSGLNSDSALKMPKDEYAALLDRNMDETARRHMIRAQLTGKLPVDPNGLVKILFFLKPSEQGSLSVAREISKAISSPSLDVPIAVVPLSVEPLGLNSSNSFIQATGLPAMLRDGVALSRSLNIARIPAVAFLTSKSNKAFVQNGEIDSVFIEEVSKIIGGK